jgi:hypothetical protein
VQILTITDLLNGAEIKMPREVVTFKEAQRVKPKGPKQREML